MAATVRQVVATVGSAVARGDPIVVVESMKMELPIAADVPGRVAQVRVAPGDDIAEGDVVAVLEDGG